MKRLKVKKLSCTALLPLDDDGTPIHNGERLVEVAPGRWQHPLALALEKYLEDHGDERR